MPFHIFIKILNSQKNFSKGEKKTKINARFIYQLNKSTNLFIG